MALLMTVLKPGDLAKLGEHQVDILVAALDAEVLSNAAVKRAVAQKVQSVHKELAAEQKAAK